MNRFRGLEIVMVSMNNSKDFRISIESIKKLLGSQCRVIVVDSSSTTEILEESNRLIDLGNDIHYKWEDPQGIYHAMNTGLSLCKDDTLVWFLNPGDVVTDSSLILELIELITQNDSKWGYGLSSYDNDAQFPPRLFPKITKNTLESLFNGELQISHQSMLVLKEVLVTSGDFNTKFRIAADLDFQFKLLKCYSPAILPKHLIVVETSGVSHEQQIRTLVESFVIRWRRPEFSVFEKVSWLIRFVLRRVKSSAYIKLRHAK
jgi:glycosyltransferase involved in cell wall biosynthesis